MDMFINGLLWCCHLLLVFSETGATMANVSTACFGAPGNTCTDHRLTCTEPMIISITNITFGYRRGCSAVGVADCRNTTCCRDETGDCFIPYNQTLLSQLQQTCNGRSTCTVNRNNDLDENSSFCGFGNIFHSYSKIEYHCTEKTPSSTLQSTTETSSMTIVSTKTVSNTITSNQTSTYLPDTQDSSTYTTKSSTTTAPSSTLQSTTETSPTTIVSTKTVSNTVTSNRASTYLPNTQDSTQAEENKTDTDVGGIVGGIIGVILIIAVAAAVIFFVKRRKADKKPSKDVDHVNKNGSNRPYQTDTTIPQTTATPVYYELEKSINNTSKPNSTKPTSGDNYGYIGGDNHVKHATGKDNYNHIGISGVTSDDEYHHLKGTNSNKPSVPDSNYNHIGSFSTAEDNYQHIGDNKTRIITDDTYNHIDGHDNTGLDSDDYHHIGSGHEHQVLTDGTYNHIGGDHNEILGDDDYHHIGNGNTQPIITDGEYSHIGGADA